MKEPLKINKNILSDLQPIKSTKLQLSNSLIKDGQSTKSLAKNGQSIKSLAKDTQSVKSLAKDAQFVKSLAKDAQSVKSLAKDAQSVKSSAEDAQSVKSVVKDAQSVESAVTKVQSVKLKVKKSNNKTTISEKAQPINSKSNDNELNLMMEEIRNFKPTEEQINKMKELKETERKLEDFMKNINIKKIEEQQNLLKNNEKNINVNKENSSDNSSDNNSDNYTNNYTDKHDENCNFIDILGIVTVVLSLILYAHVCADYEKFNTPVYDYLYKIHIICFPFFIFLYYLTIFRPTKNYFSYINNSDYKYTIVGGVYTYFYVMIGFLAKLD